MLTIVIAVLAGILLTHLFESALKAIVIVGVMLGILWLGRGITFEALTDDAARALYNETGCNVGITRHHTQRSAQPLYGRGERI